MRLCRYILLLIAILSCISAYGQDLHDYRYYKLFEDETTEAVELQTDSIVADTPRKSYGRRLLDYNFRFVRTMRRGASLAERQTSLGGICVEGLYRSAATRLQLVRNETDGLTFSSASAGGAFGNAEYACDTIVQERTSVAFNLSSRNYLAGINANTAWHAGRNWSLAVDVSARTGRDAHIKSIFTNEMSLDVMAVKQFDSLHRLSAVVLLSPVERGTRQASTREAFGLRGNTLYSPSWGYQNGKVRNSHVRRDMVPVAVAMYEGQITAQTSLSASVGTTLGIRRYSILDWFDAPTPAPDNYRRMPSYFTDAAVADMVADAWRRGDTRYTQIDFDELVARNRLTGDESVYAVADRVERITRLQMRVAATTALAKNMRITYGIDALYDRSRRYKQMRDLLGGRPITDIDHYLIDDDAFCNSLQNNLLTPNRRIDEGDRYGYDYALSRTSASLFCALNYVASELYVDATVEIGYGGIVRKGFYRKELFADNSYGRSRVVRLSPYALRLAVGYDISKQHRLRLAALVRGDMPEAENLFLQADYNNRTIDNPVLRKTFAAEAVYTFAGEKIDLSATAFCSLTRSDTESDRLYDDTSGEYADMVVSGIDVLRYGVEAELNVRLAEHWRISAALAAGCYKYAANPRITLYADNDNRLLCDRVQSYVGKCTVGGAPQVMATAEIAYFNRGWGVSVNAAYAGLRYVTPSFLRRTERVAYMADSPELFDEFMRQERLKDAFSIDLSLSKTLYLSRFDKRIYTAPHLPRFIDRHSHSRLTFYLSVGNLLGGRNTVYSGYESSRLQRNWLAGAYTFRPQASRYLYAYPRTYYFAVRFTF